MCGPKGGGQPFKPTQVYHPTAGPDAGKEIVGDPGIPQEFIDRGIYDTQGYQNQLQRDISDKQLQQQKDISDQQLAFNKQQVADQKAQQDKLQAQADAQSARQSTYDKGRADLLAAGSKQVGDAFARFSPEYFNEYSSDYLKKATDDIQYQKDLAQKQLLFGLARQGLSSSQAAVDQQGLLEEDKGRAVAAQTQNAQDATNTLKAQVAGTKQNLLGQVTAAESVAPPIAGVNDQAVTAGLDTTRQAISGVTNTSGDVIASLGGVPTVSPLTNIFTNVLGGVGSYVGGQNALGISNSYANSRSAGLGGTNPNRSSTGP
jgi:hypothetical protein